VTGRVSMHLANDYVHPYRAFRSSYSQCRIRIYVPPERAGAASCALHKPLGSQPLSPPARVL